MIHIELLVLLLVPLAWGAEICCPEVNNVCYNDNPPFENMPLPFCPDEMQVSMRLFTRENRDPGEVITRTTIPPIYSSARRTHFVVHGWLQGRNANWLHNMKESILTRVDCNVILVGWEGGSRELWYPQSASNTRTVGTHLAATINNLVTNGGGSETDFYCAGHSLGSHVCGHTGSYTQSLHGFQIDRITGLDPAGPWFENKDWSVGLNPSCARLVDNIHTNGEAGIVINLGTMKVLGDVDFYPNGGGTQPGCILDPLDPEYQRKMVEGGPMVDLTPACSHMRAFEYYEESIFSSCSFYSRMKCTDPYNLPGSCTSFTDPQQAMGYTADDPSFDQSGIFYLDTNDREPFCLG